MRYRPSSLGDYSKLGWDASYRGATWTSECSEASVRKTLTVQALQKAQSTTLSTLQVLVHMSAKCTQAFRGARDTRALTPALTAQNTNRHRRGAKFRVTGH